MGYRRSLPQACRGPHNSKRVPYVRPSVARISYYAALATTTHAAFSQRKPHEVAQCHQPQQEIPDTWAENDGRSPTKPFRPGSYPLSSQGANDVPVALLGSIPATNPDFLWSFVGSLHFMRLSLKERRTRGPVQSRVQEIGAIDGCPILRVLCEGWDTQISPFCLPQQPDITESGFVH
jgi:hypothetical protein